MPQEAIKSTQERRVSSRVYCYAGWYSYWYDIVGSVVVAVLLGRVLGSMQSLHPLAIPPRLPRAVDEANLQCPPCDIGDLWPRHILRLTLPLHSGLFHMGRRGGKMPE